MKKKIIVLTGLIVFMLVAFGGFTYAIFTNSKSQEGSNSVSTYNCLDIQITGEEEINLDNAFPIEDAEGLLQTPYKFKVKNKCNQYVAMDLGIELQSNNTLLDEAIKVAINKKYEEPFGVLLSSKRIIENEVISNKYLTFHDGINANSEQNYELRVWIDYNAGLEIEGSVFKGKVIANAIIRTSEPHGWSNSEDNMLLYALKRDNELTMPLTTPPIEISLENERILASSPDNYGTSYYFRGNVQNNYVVFANKCWRIVRITGDGSIKLILHNNDGIECNINDYTKNFAKYDGIHTVSKYNSNLKPLYVGFMYGDKNADNYNDAYANINDSIILTNLKAWYDLPETFTLKEKSLLADVIWCNDKRISQGDGLTQGKWTAYSKYYLVDKNHLNLTCGNNTLIKYTAIDTTNGNGDLKGYKIGLLTVDEAIFAGGHNNRANNNYYLYNGLKYWLLTPGYYDNGARMYAVGTTGGLSSGGIYVDSNQDFRLRPSIALISNVKITNTNQNGTINNPYIIDEN